MIITRFLLSLYDGFRNNTRSYIVPVKIEKQAARAHFVIWFRGGVIVRGQTKVCCGFMFLYFSGYRLQYFCGAVFDVWACIAVGIVAGFSPYRYPYSHDSNLRLCRVKHGALCQVTLLRALDDTRFEAQMLGAHLAGSIVGLLDNFHFARSVLITRFSPGKG